MDQLFDTPTPRDYRGQLDSQVLTKSEIFHKICKSIFKPMSIYIIYISILPSIKSFFLVAFMHMKICINRSSSLSELVKHIRICKNLLCTSIYIFHSRHAHRNGRQSDTSFLSTLAASLAITHFSVARLRRLFPADSKANVSKQVSEIFSLSCLFDPISPSL